MSVARWSSHLSAGGSVVISSMKWDSCRLTSWSRWHTSTTLCFLKLQRYKLTSANLNSSASSDITLSVSASRCSTDVQQPAQSVRRNRSAPQHDPRISVWRQRERYKHISDRRSRLDHRTESSRFSNQWPQISFRPPHRKLSLLRPVPVTTDLV